MDKTINNYFIEFEKNLKCKRVNQNTGYKYNFLEEGKKNEIIRFFIDNNLDASISTVKSNKSCLFKFIDKSDLLIIGICLEGKKVIDYKGKNLIEEGDVFYFRPTEDFGMHYLEHSCLYYFLDLDGFKETLNCRVCKNSHCGLYGDKICSKGKIIIDKLPYVMKSRINEIKNIKNMETNNFLNYANIKSQLFNYLDWLIKLRLERDSFINNKECSSCPVPGAKKIIMDNLDNQITVKEIAERLNVSTYKLQKSFKRKEGTTVYDFIRKVRIDNSKMLLKESNFPIIDISQKFGYENPSKFATAFKDVTGFTPSEYRKTIQD